jgi:hypothetical protein
MTQWITVCDLHNYIPLNGGCRYHISCYDLDTDKPQIPGIYASPNLVTYLHAVLGRCNPVA